MSDFEQLGDEGRKAAIDVGVAAAVIGVRVPAAGQLFFDYIATEFSAAMTASNNLPVAVSKQALREVGRSLFESDWSFTVQKKGNELVTKFERMGSGNNDNPLQESRVIH